MFNKAEKKKSYLRLALVGPSGSGKTYTALEIATGLSEKTGKQIAVIDSEHGSAQLYADKFDFLYTELDHPFALRDYINAIKEAEKADIGVLIIDSTTHGWQFLLDQIETIAKTKFKGNNFSAWSIGTPMYNEWIEAMLSFKGHIIVTMRAKTEYALEEVNGKKVPQKVGMGAEQRKGIEYEFTMLMEGTVDHYFTITKDRTSKFQDNIIQYPSRELGYELHDWLNQGNGFLEHKSYTPPKPEPQNTEQQKQNNNNVQRGNTMYVRCTNLITEGLKSGWIHKSEEEALRGELNTSKNTNNLAGLEKTQKMLESRKNNFKPKNSTQVASDRTTELQNKINKGLGIIKDYEPYDSPETVENFLISKLGVADPAKCSDTTLLEDCYQSLLNEYDRVKRSA